MGEADYISTYRRFFEEYVATLNIAEDPLPLRVASYSLEPDDVLGQIIDCCVQYLYLINCPSALQSYLTKLAVDKVYDGFKKSPQSSYDPLFIMRSVTKTVGAICRQHLDNETVSKLPAPPTRTFVSALGIRHVRRKMEDKMVYIPKLNKLYNLEGDEDTAYYAIFDGHNGVDVANYAVAHLHQFLVESPHYLHNIEQAFVDAYTKTDERVISKKIRGGSTGLAIIHESNRLVVSWLGDSQAMMIKAGRPVMLVDPHRPDRPDEVERIQRAGGYVFQLDGIARVNGDLGVARALGDEQFKPMVTSVPDVLILPLDGTEDAVILGSDGFWDVLNPELVCGTFQFQVQSQPDRLDLLSGCLVDLAKEYDSGDNISVIVVLLKPPSEITGPTSNAMDAPEIHPFRSNGSILKDIKQEPEDFGPETDVDAPEDNSPYGDQPPWTRPDPLQVFPDLSAIKSSPGLRFTNDYSLDNPFSNNLDDIAEEKSDDKQEKEKNGTVNGTHTLSHDFDAFRQNFKDEIIENIAKSAVEPIFNEKMDVKRELPDVVNVQDLETAAKPLVESFSPDFNIGGISQELTHVADDIINTVSNETVFGNHENGLKGDHSISVSRSEINADIDRFGFDYDQGPETLCAADVNSDFSNFNERAVDAGESAQKITGNGLFDLSESSIKEKSDVSLSNELFDASEPTIADVESAVHISKDLFDTSEPLAEVENADQISKDPFDVSGSTNADVQISKDLFDMSEPTIAEVEKSVESSKNPFDVQQNVTDELDDDKNPFDSKVIAETLEFNEAAPKLNAEEKSLFDSDVVQLETLKSLVAAAAASDSVNEDDVVGDDCEMFRSDASPAHLPATSMWSDGDHPRNDDEDVVETCLDGEESEEEWNFYKPQDKENLSPDSHAADMNSPLNPDAAEFVPVVAPVEHTTPLKAVPGGLIDDFIVSSPKWDNMDAVVVPDEDTFMKEVKTKPGDVSLDPDVTPFQPSSADALDMEGIAPLGEETDVQDPLIDSSRPPIIQNEPELIETPMPLSAEPSPEPEPELEPVVISNHVLTPEPEMIVPMSEPEPNLVETELPNEPRGLDLATDMTSSFIDPYTIGHDETPLPQESQLSEISDINEAMSNVNIQDKLSEHSPADKCEIKEEQPAVEQVQPVEIVEPVAVAVDLAQDAATLSINEPPSCLPSEPLIDDLTPALNQVDELTEKVTKPEEIKENPAESAVAATAAVATLGVAAAAVAAVKKTPSKTTPSKTTTTKPATTPKSAPPKKLLADKPKTPVADKSKAPTTPRTPTTKPLTPKPAISKVGAAAGATKAAPPTKPAVKSTIPPRTSAPAAASAKPKVSPTTNGVANGDVKAAAKPAVKSTIPPRTASAPTRPRVPSAPTNGVAVSDAKPAVKSTVPPRTAAPAARPRVPSAATNGLSNGTAKPATTAAKKPAETIKSVPNRVPLTSSAKPAAPKTTASKPAPRPASARPASASAKPKTATTTTAAVKKTTNGIAKTEMKTDVKTVASTVSNGAAE